MLRNLYLVIANWLLVLNTLLNTQSLRVALHVLNLLMTRSRVFTTQAEAYITFGSFQFLSTKFAQIVLCAQFRAKVAHAMLVGHFSPIIA